MGQRQWSHLWPVLFWTKVNVYLQGDPLFDCLLTSKMMYPWNFRVIPLSIPLGARPAAPEPKTTEILILISWAEYHLCAVNIHHSLSRIHRCKRSLCPPFYFYLIPQISPLFFLRPHSTTTEGTHVILLTSLPLILMHKV